MYIIDSLNNNSFFLKKKYSINTGGGWWGGGFRTTRFQFSISIILFSN